MIRYTTPAISLLVDGKDLTGQDVYVSLEQGKTKLMKTGTDLVMTVTEEGTEIVFTLSQTESAMFDYGKSTKALGVDVEPNFGPDRAGDIKHSNADISKAKRLLGYDPEWSFARGIEAAIEWYKENL